MRKVLIWDKFTCHTTSSVENAAKSVGEVEYIPPGCTDLIQPLDTHLNRIVKAKFREEFTKWVNDNGGSEIAKSGRLKLPSFELLIQWIVLGIFGIKQDIIKRSFEFCGENFKCQETHIFWIRDHCVIGREGENKPQTLS
jgi:hypothetical protein